ncbi:hypothetical protein [Chitinilyticum piscinae]|uniref:Uncharacterized protein n=1 Tax=Chitinilyticum piscinae TaxID=2866724 RepID=A0A8J7KC34_9NEIS|nr:hypothetical protein [Chitinilyticum piscinae]MBE9610909.1 hypothetical protein [Chitinilyticum piscinae]
MDAQQQLFGLMALAEDQQKAVQAAIEALEAERETLQREREAFKQATSAAAGVVVEVKQAAAAAIPGVQKAAENAVGAAVRVSLAGASQAAANALETASSPILSALTGVVRAGESAADRLNAASAAFGWRWATVAGGISAGAIVAVSLVAWGAVWWQRGEVESLQAERQALATDVARLQVSVADLEKRGGRIVMNDCGGRLCIEASGNQGRDSNGKPAPLGSWTTKAGAILVIPKGY